MFACSVCVRGSEGRSMKTVECGRSGGGEKGRDLGSVLKAECSRAPHPWGIHSKVPSGVLKPQMEPNLIESVFPLCTSL